MRALEVSHRFRKM